MICRLVDYIHVYTIEVYAHSIHQGQKWANYLQEMRVSTRMTNGFFFFFSFFLFFMTCSSHHISTSMPQVRCMRRWLDGPAINTRRVYAIGLPSIMINRSARLIPPFMQQLGIYRSDRFYRFFSVAHLLPWLWDVTSISLRCNIPSLTISSPRFRVRSNTESSMWITPAPWKVGRGALSSSSAPELFPQFASPQRRRHQSKSLDRHAPVHHWAAAS